MELLVFCLMGCALVGAPTSWAMEAHRQESFQEHVHKQCSFTKYPGICVDTVLGSSGHQNADFVSALVEKIIDETEVLTPNLPSYKLESSTATTHAHAGYCVQLMNMSLKWLNRSVSALKDSPRKNKHDIQTWLSAVMTFQQTCKDSVKGLPGYLSVISDEMDNLSRLVSNSLALINRISGLPKNSTSAEQVFPEWVSAKDRKLLQTTKIKANAVVSTDGSGNYKTISEAINAASGERFVIYVKSGVYKEKIHTNKDGITLIGDGKYSTLIVGDDSVIGGSTLPGSATFTITGDGFIARDIGFQNTAGPGGEQAIALSIASDHSVLYKCSIAGYQDTLYALALRQFYRECDIYGTIDFIFGNAVAVFQNCYLVLRRPKGKAYNVILAQGRSDSGQNTGFSIQDCKITVSSDFSPLKNSYKSYLGRPWKEYSRSVIMESTIDDAISPRGWIEWPGSSKVDKLYFAEYFNGGPGAATSKRVQWTGYHVIGSEEASKFTVGKFIAGTSWLPSTGVTFISGLS
ncbi:hypothetical protein HHK36_021946 [Tetracentron sinense]|uniref:Pectinesterase n=1 Tax=Tetracentron sinense TaxID=13715 RepID=A0A834YQL9_TETSI|nr:hypothetical protein HHK36_021946 [Tetracentron sinense]